MNNYKKEEKTKSSRGDSFQDFQDKTNDAWEDNDDELMLDISNIKMSLYDVRKTAEEVISNHSRQSGTKYSNVSSEYSGKKHTHFMCSNFDVALASTAGEKTKCFCFGAQTSKTVNFTLSKFSLKTWWPSPKFRSSC